MYRVRFCVANGFSCEHLCLGNRFRTAPRRFCTKKTWIFATRFIDGLRTNFFPTKSVLAFLCSAED